MTITQQQADDFLRADLLTYEAHVRRICNYLELNQNQFDALVSFTYNCGSGNLIKLTKNQTRTVAEIAEHIEAYNKGASGVLPGLVRRRKEEKELFLMANIPEKSITEKEQKIKEVMNVEDRTINWFEDYKWGLPYLIDKMYSVCVDAEKWRNQAKK